VRALAYRLGMQFEAANFHYAHPHGPIYGWFSARGLAALRLPHAENGAARMPVLHSAANDRRFWALREAFERYFAGVRETFDAIPLDLEAGTAFQRAVWEAARTVSWGQTAAYGELAERMGKPPGAARAVGHALGMNPLPIVVPCHRFLAADGRLTGYAAGLPWKRELLELEGCLLH
jgi:methylated-DNA-[protein]-cysteine S-methyltransferase